MRLGILTFFNAHNYGAVMQAYALKTYLKSLGHEVQIINYRNPCIDKAYPRHLYPRLGKKDILLPSHWMNTYKEIERCFYSNKVWEQQYIKFKNFVEFTLNVREDVDWKSQIDKLDIIFFGSDQIWEKKIVGNKERVLFGNFKTSAKKVSYAASCYSEESAISNELIQSLKKFTFISVREKNLALIIQKKLEMSKKIYTVVDPVFLLDKEDYQCIINRAPCLKENYIVFYFVSENKELSKISQYIREKKDKKVIEIHYYRTKQISNDWQRADIGPDEFLSLLYYADAVYTNSFHGTAFSLIFHKHFWVLNNNMRIVNLLGNCHMEERRIADFNDWIKRKHLLTDFSQCDRDIKSMVSSSKKYIDRVLRTD